jgi:hypothetical protein
MKKLTLSRLVRLVDEGEGVTLPNGASPTVIFMLRLEVEFATRVRRSNIIGDLIALLRGTSMSQNPGVRTPLLQSPCKIEDYAVIGDCGTAAPSFALVNSD